MVVVQVLQLYIFRWESFGETTLGYGPYYGNFYGTMAHSSTIVSLFTRYMYVWNYFHAILLIASKHSLPRLNPKIVETMAIDEVVDGVLVVVMVAAVEEEAAVVVPEEMVVVFVPIDA